MGEGLMTIFFEKRKQPAEVKMNYSFKYFGGSLNFKGWREWVYVHFYYFFKIKNNNKLVEVK